MEGMKKRRKEDGRIEGRNEGRKGGKRMKEGVGMNEGREERKK